MAEDGFTLYCPKCNSRVAELDFKTKVTYEAKCKRCNKLVVYNPLNNTKKLKDIPLRSCASGCRFY